MVGPFSRHLLCETLVDSKGRLFLGDRSRYLYRDLSDNRYHVVVEGDSLYTLAATYFGDMPRPAGFFWVIADFQPVPIHDPTVALEVGRTLIIPSARVLIEEILNPNRTLEYEG